MMAARRSWIALAAIALGCPASPTQVAPPRPIGPVVVAPPLADAHAIDAPPAPPPWTALRLPRAIEPTGYRVRLAIDPGKTTFSGAVELRGMIAAATTTIYLHDHGLEVTRATAQAADASAPAVPLAITRRTDEVIELRADAPLAAGSWLLALDYQGPYDELNTTGVFRQTVTGAHYVFSQFEALYARRAFPCVDEPDVKVPWQLTLDVPTGLVAASNTSIVSHDELAPGTQRVVFAETLPLPSYLVAFAVGPFDVVNAGATRHGVPIRVLALKGRTADAAYAAKSTGRLVELLEDWFAMPYPYDKLDMVAIPITVGFGAMENPGLVTFGEPLILIDPAKGSWIQRLNWIGTAAHELAHQWFGDLVTMRWWDDIWLNEGFATWMETKIADRFDPTWHEIQYELGVRQAALDADSVISARRIRQPIERADDVLNVFDGITYEKGASVLGMFESFVGADAFQRGVRAYVTKRARGSATSADFVAAVSEAAGRDLAPAFASFLDQAGAPELDVTLACDGNGAHVEVGQHRLLAAGSPAPDHAQTWTLPVCVAYDDRGKRAQACALIEHARDAFALSEVRGGACPRWLMPNASGRGYYRSVLTAPQVATLRDEAWPQLTANERRTLFHDVADAARIGRGQPAQLRLPLALALSLVPAMLAQGDRYAIIDGVGLPLALDSWVTDDLRPKYEAYLRATFGPAAKKFGLVPTKSDNLDVERTRAVLVGAAAWSGRDPEMVKQASELAVNWRELPGGVRELILEIATDADRNATDRLIAELRKEPSRVLRSEILSALGSVRSPERVTKALDLLLDPTFDVREAMDLLGLASRDETAAAIEAFFRAHRTELMKRIPADEVTGTLGRLTHIFTRRCDASQRDEAVRYMTDAFESMPGGNRVVHQAIERLDQCIANRALLAPQVRAWLGGYKAPKPKTADKPAAPPDKPGKAH